MSFDDHLAALLDAKLAPLLQQIERVTTAVDAVRKALPPQLVTLPQAAEILGISLSTVRRRVKDGTLPSKRVGRVLRVDLTALNGPTEAQVFQLVRDIKAG